ncbi:hypothetical protein GPJ56_007644 [Histomonas meleagridis]|uniref:uncharacterized protein n=1 Tax=Histomonas meleagridis TaxID=135588 RepID=UPI0035594BA5|nr:hypothetical protein GPJ56_007644 [Histomonas meleagridis]KAH0799441.1 hypothetical protein GO595_007842 [Histomonas meleagridis]
MKRYNLEGDEHAGKTLVGNWYEDREWGDSSDTKKINHGMNLTSVPGYENKYKTTNQKAFGHHDNLYHKRIPPRQARREQETFKTTIRDLQNEELEQENHQIEFTRKGKFLPEPTYHENLQLDYMEDEPITLYSETRHNFGRDSHFTTPIQDYIGHRIVKDD